MNRRGFIGAMLAAAAAPAFIRSGSLMPIYVPKPLVLWGDGIHDDTGALSALVGGVGSAMVKYKGASIDRDMGILKIPAGTFRIQGPIDLRKSTDVHIIGSQFLCNVNENSPVIIASKQMQGVLVERCMFRSVH